MHLAITRAVSPAMARCELTHLERVPIDLELAVRQHRAYTGRLTELGCAVTTLPADPDHPDSVFVEDTAVVLDELAVLTRPGAAARRGEVASVEAVLSAHRQTVRLEAPATLDGGDVVVTGRRVFVGRSSRTNEQGLAQLCAILAPYGYDVRGVPFRNALHLKSAATFVGDGLLLVNPAWVDPGHFGGLEPIAVHPDEPHGANGLRVGDTFLHADAFPGTRRRLEARGITVATADISELAKAEGAITCSCLVFTAR